MSVRTVVSATVLALAACTTPGDNTAARRDIAKAFVDLTFTNEGGQRRGALGRWSGPVRVRLDPAFGREALFLDAHLADLSRATGLEITRVLRGPAEIEVRAGPVRGLADVICTARFEGNWRTIPRFTGGTVRIPAGAPPYRVRLCLIEEITQLLGPINDLSILPDSVFNDDQSHHRLTDFDRRILRVLYDDAMPEGATPFTAQAAAFGILSRETGLSPLPPAAPGWEKAYRDAARARVAGDRDGALRALDRAGAALEALPKDDHRWIKTLSGRAFLLLPDDPAAAARVAQQAIDNAASGSIRGAEARLILAQALLARGDRAGARRAAEPAQPVARAFQRTDLSDALEAIMAQ